MSSLYFFSLTFAGGLCNLISITSCPVIEQSVIKLFQSSTLPYTARKVVPTLNLYQISASFCMTNTDVTLYISCLRRSLGLFLLGAQLFAEQHNN